MVLCSFLYNEPFPEFWELADLKSAEPTVGKGGENGVGKTGLPGTSQGEWTHKDGQESSVSHCL